MKELLNEMMKDNRRVYIYFNDNELHLYTKYMVANGIPHNIVANEYKDIHEMVKDLRQYYLVNYLKDEPGNVLVRNFK